MIAIRLFHGFVFAETLILLVVVVIHGRTIPFPVAFNAEVIIGFYGQRTGAVGRFKGSLSKLDARRYFVGFHLFYGQWFVLLDVLQPAFIDVLARQRPGE